MPEKKSWKTLGFALASLLAFMIGAFMMITNATPVQAGEADQETESYCLGCHSNPELSMPLPDGETLSLTISAEMLQSSIHHQAGIECQACHTAITTYPHPPVAFNNRRELTRSYYQACQKCHSANYEKTLDSIHANAAAAGNLNAPVCTDCHGAHDVQPPDEPRSKISTTCGKCHDSILADYKNSIHGSALIQEDNPDVPVCTDCHGVHNIQDPRTAKFRVEEPDLCAQCHADSELMAKYGIRSDVYNLYNLSWHGLDISIFRARWPTLWHNSAVCSDCHGVHNILPTDNPASLVNPGNLLSTCQKCHPQAGPNWTGAWVGHNRIDAAKTPFLFYTEKFYQSFVPGVLWLSLIYVALQFVHTVINRIRRSLR